MKIEKVLVLILALLVTSLGAMSVTRKIKIEDVLKEDDVETLRELVENKKIFPNKSFLLGRWPNFDEYDSPLFYATLKCSTKCIEYLLGRTPDGYEITDNEKVKKAIPVIFDKGNPGSVRLDEKSAQACQKSDALLLAAAQDREINRSEALGAYLLTHRGLQMIEDSIESLKLFLQNGADRTYRTSDGLTLIETMSMWAKVFKDNKYFQMIELLRTYAPDLKTKTALMLLNQIRTGTLTEKQLTDINNLDRASLELMAKLASVDPETYSKWKKMGMPSFPMDFEEELETKEAE